MVPIVSSLDLGFTVYTGQHTYCGPNGVLIIEVPHTGQLTVVSVVSLLQIRSSTYRTAYCGPNGVLIIEVPLNRTAYYGPNSVLITEVPHTGQHTVVPMVSLL